MDKNVANEGSVSPTPDDTTTIEHAASTNEVTTMTPTTAPIATDSTMSVATLVMTGDTNLNAFASPATEDLDVPASAALTTEDAAVTPATGKGTTMAEIPSTRNENATMVEVATSTERSSTMAAATTAVNAPTLGTTTQMAPRYYCHNCHIEFELNNSNYICPVCREGFIEEVQRTSTTASTISSSSGWMSASSSVADTEHRRLLTDYVRSRIATILRNRSGLNLPTNVEPAPGGIGRVVRIADLIDRSGASGSRVNVNNAPEAGSGTNVAAGSASNNAANSGSNTQANVTMRPSNSRGTSTLTVQGVGVMADGLQAGYLQGVDQLVVDFLQNISRSNGSGIYIGNPADYAWGRHGLDRIVTELLNQTENAGPPPLPKEKMSEIPVVEITAEDVDNKLQCSVCWEDYNPTDVVRKLPCLHMFHEDCILPWLGLHATCPVCREVLYEEEPIENAQNTDPNPNTQTNIFGFDPPDSMDDLD